MSNIVIGLDFGSSFVKIVKKGEGLVLKESNLIAIKKINGAFYNICAGDKAKFLQEKTDERTTIFSPVNAGEIISMDHAVYVLKEFLDKLNIKKSLFNSLKIIALVPMGITEEEKQKYITLCENVGAKEVILVPRIFCSALGENINIKANNAHLIVDIGGGVVDCAVLNLNTIIKGSTLSLGGRNIDATIIDYVKQKYGAIIGAKSAKMLKEEIGSMYPNDSAKMEVNAVDINTNTPMIINVTANDIYVATHTFLDEIVRIIKTTIKTLSPEISSDVVRNGIIICGGYSKMVGIEKYLRQKLGLNIFISDDSNSSTSIGLNKLLNDDELLEKILGNL